VIGLVSSGGCWRNSGKACPKEIKFPPPDFDYFEREKKMNRPLKKVAKTSAHPACIAFAVAAGVLVGYAIFKEYCEPPNRPELPPVSLDWRKFSTLGR
jgi:hypothetical protein